jgi:DNA-binding beta-propeller fold protein YncE
MPTFAYVSNSGGGTVTRIDLDTFTLAAALTVGTGPSGLAIDPSGAFAYVAITGPGSNSVRKIDLSTFKTVGQPVKVGQGPRMVVIDSAGSFAYTPNYLGRSVTRIALSKFVPALSSNIADRPVSIVIDNAGTFAYVVTDAPSVIKINLKAFRLTATLALTYDGGTQYDVAIDPSDTYLYVVNHNANTVTKIALDDFTVSATLTLETPNAIVIDSSGTFAYVTNHAGDLVTRIDLDQFNLAGTVGAGCAGIALDSTGNIYATDANAGTVSLIDHETFKVVGSPVSVGSQPHSIVIDSVPPPAPPAKPDVEPFDYFYRERFLELHPPHLTKEF